MGTDILEKVNQLPLDKQKEVEDFVNHLLEQATRNGKASPEVIERRKKNAGRMKGLIWMADDFNETSEDFKDYM